MLGVGTAMVVEEVITEPIGGIGRKTRTLGFLTVWSYVTHMKTDFNVVKHC